MDDATLNPEADGSQPPDVQLQAIVNRLSRRLGESAGTPVPLDGGITNRNFRARFGGAEYVIRIPGKDTSLLEIDRGAELIANERAAECGIAPEVAAMLDDPQCIVTEFIEGEGLSSEQLRAPAVLAEVARSLRVFHGLEQPLSTSFDSFRIVETYAETATGRGATLPDAYAEAHRVCGRDRGGFDRPRARAGALPQRPAGGELHRRGRGRAALPRRLGVRRDGRPLLRPRQLRRQQRARRDGRGGADRRHTSASG